MQQNRTKKIEHIKIVNFSNSADGIATEDLLLEIPIGTSEIVKAAMLKGFNDYFYKVASSTDENVFSPETMDAIEKTLDGFREKMGVKKSGLILP
jgi:hypothetical protein